MNRIDEMILKFRDVLKETERLGPDDLRAYQQSLLEPLLLHARKHVPFYRDRLSAVFDGEKIDYSRWSEIPLLTRAQAQQNGKALSAAMVPPHLGTITEEETSGSTGRPLRFLINELLEVATLAMMDRLYRWWRIDGSKTMVTFTAPKMNVASSEQSETYGWQTGSLEGKNILRKSTGDFDSHIDWLSENKADYLGIPSGMLRPLAERTRERGVKLKFDGIISRGGTVDEEIWPLCRKVFKARLIDQYGANEIGQIACQCPHCKIYHINSEVVLVEILDQEGSPVSPGETGRVVLTSFYNYAMPFIRYEIGDFAQLAESGSDCEIKLPRLTRIMGRFRNSFLLKDGRVVFPHPTMTGFGKFFSYSQIQIVQTDYENLEVRYVPAEANDITDEAGLERWLQKELDAPFNVRLVEVETLSALPSGKFEDFLSLVERPGQSEGKK